MFFQEAGGLVRISREMPDDAIHVGLEGMDIERERPAVAFATMDRAMRRHLPVGVKGRHLVARRARVLRVGEMKVPETPGRTQHQQNAAVEAEAEEETFPALRVHVRCGLFWFEM